MGFLKTEQTGVALDRFTDNSLDELQDDINNRELFQNELIQNLLKGLTLINGGAIIGLLTFMGNSDVQIDGMLMKSSFVNFSGALLATFFAYLFAFFSQGSFARGSVYAKRRLTTPSNETAQYNQMRKLEDKSRFIGQIFFWLSAALMIGALLLFACGGVQAVEAITL